MVKRLLGLVVVVALAACAPDVVLSGGSPSEPPTGQPPANAPPSNDPYMTGVVRDLTVTVPVTEGCEPADADGDGVVSSDDPPVCNPDPDHYGAFLVVRRGGGQGEDRAWVSVPESAGIARRDGQGVEPATFGDISNGSAVSVWITGVVAESYPVQTTATFVLLES